MTPEEAYCEYVAIKNHFATPLYDYFRFGGRLKNVNQKTYNARADAYYFEKLADHHDIQGLLVAHLVENPQAWIGDIIRNQVPYLERRRVIDSLTMIFKEDLAAFNGNLDAALKMRPYEIPGLVRLYLGGDISLETATIINDITGVSKLWHGEMIQPVCQRLEKYQPFMVEFTHGGYSRRKYFDIVKEYFRKGLETDSGPHK